MEIAALNRGIAASAWRDHASWMAAADAVYVAECKVVESLASTALLTGYCSLCARDSVFVRNAAGSPREDLACGRCHCIGRQRATAALLFDALPVPARARVYATEHASPFHVVLRRRVRHLHGSEFAPSWRKRLHLSQWLWRQRVAAWVRYGDLTALPFPDAAFDGVVSQDVLEHVPDYRAGLREIARILKPGAPLVFTVPFYDARSENEQIASIDPAGRVLHEGEPEYHGDPISGGTPCFHHFGWSLLAAARDAGFRDAAAYRVQDAACGLPHPQWVMRATR